MDTQVLYNIFHQESFGLNIAIYFYLTGLSAGSFILSTLAYGFDMNQYKPLGKIGVVLATILLVMAPFLLLIALVLWSFGWGKPFLLFIPVLLGLLWALRGLEIDINDKGQNVYISIK